MNQQKKLVLSFVLLMFVAITVVLALAAKFQRQENLPVESPTVYEKTQQPYPEITHKRTTKTKEKTETDVRMPDETAVKLAQAWNQRRGQEIANLFTPDGVLTLPNGSTIQSKPEIEKKITESQDGLLRETTLKNRVDEVSQIDADTALVKGSYQLDGVKVLGITRAEKGNFVLRAIRREGGWFITRAELRTGGDG